MYIVKFGELDGSIIVKDWEIIFKKKVRVSDLMFNARFIHTKM